MNLLKTISTLLLFGGITVTACDDNAPVSSDSASVEETEEELAYTSTNVPFDSNSVSEATRQIARTLVAVKSPDDTPIPAEFVDELEEMRLRIAHAFVSAKGAPYFAARSSEDEQIEVTYLGKGRVAPADHAFEAAFQVEAPSESEKPPYEPPAKYRGDATWITGFNPATLSEFEVRIPTSLAEIAGADADLRREEHPVDPPGTRIEEVQPRHQVGNQDTRVRKGSIDTAHTSTNLSRIARIGYGCSGVLIGQNQVLTAGHCLYGDDGWNTSTRIRVGANGTASRDDVTVGTGSQDETGIYWVSSLYKDGVDNDTSTIAYDIGTIVLPDYAVGASTGWFEIATPSNTSHDDMLNRGYPTCGLSESPPGCADPDNEFHMFGDTNNCGSGGFSAGKDAYNFSLYGFHSCDASKGHSGSPLYRNESGKGWAVRGVHIGHHRDGDSPAELQQLSNSYAALSFTLITRERKNLFDLYNAMYTSP